MQAERPAVPDTALPSMLSGAESFGVLASALEQIPDGMLVTDAQLRIVAANPAMSRLSGFTQAELLGATPRLLHSGRHDPVFYQRMWAELQQAGHWRGEIWNRRKDGSIDPQLVAITALRDAAGAISHYTATYLDVEFLRRYQSHLEYQATHDMLTSLPNRALFMQRLHAAIGRARRMGSQVAVLFMDLDRFKQVNDSLGHDAGDALLQAVSRRLTDQVREIDTVARFGGDEFAVLVDGVRDSRSVTIVARKLIGSFEQPVALAGHEVRTSLSIGISCFPQDGADAETLLKNADTAMYRAKAESRGSYQYFSADMNVRALENLMLGNSLRLALQRGELRLHYQPQFDLGSGKLAAYEALVRWQHPDYGLISPARFLPMAEESGLIEPLGDWVLDAACRQMRLWLDAGTAARRVAVNLSARQLRDPQLPARVMQALQRHGLSGNQLALEVPETLFLPDPAVAGEMLQRLKACGVGIVIDDFGTGWSSLARLRHYPVDQLKIDHSFVHGTPDDADNAAVVAAIVGLARPLGIALVAEGIETAEQRDFLREVGCTHGQGYLLAAPAAFDQMPV